MTSSANDKWSFDALEIGIETLRVCAKEMRMNKDPAWKIAPLVQTIDFIEYNMREMEITGGNGD